LIGFGNQAWVETRAAIRAPGTGSAQRMAKFAWCQARKEDSRASGYSHMRMEANRRALDEIAARQRAADERRQKDAERRRQAAMASQSVGDSVTATGSIR